MIFLAVNLFGFLLLLLFLLINTSVSVENIAILLLKIYRKLSSHNTVFNDKRDLIIMQSVSNDIFINLFT